jgi:hypothetical protein
MRGRWLIAGMTRPGRYRRRAGIVAALLWLAAADAPAPPAAPPEPESPADCGCGPPRAPGGPR